ncbi:MAG: hypothetical protein ABR565_03245 [Gammaproteobacteria bacterium]
MDIELVVDITGWAGAGCLLAAYWLVSNGRLTGRSWAYQLLNISGAILLSVNSGYYGAFPSVGLNIVWISVGLYTLYALHNATNAPVDRGH